MGPAINAEYRRGQLAGFYVDRKEVVTASLDNMTRPELEAKLKEIRDHNVINGEAIGVEIKEVIEFLGKKPLESKRSIIVIEDIGECSHIVCHSFTIYERINE